MVFTQQVRQKLDQAFPQTKDSAPGRFRSLPDPASIPPHKQPAPECNHVAERHQYTNEKVTNETNHNKSNGAVSNDKVKIHHLNFGEEDQMEIFGYKINRLKNCLVWTFYVLTLGILRLIFHWNPKWKLLATHSACPLDSAEMVLIVDNYKGKYKSYFVKEVEILTCHEETRAKDSADGLDYARNVDFLTVYLQDGSRKKLREARIVRCKKLMYVWDIDKNKFLKLVGLDQCIKNEELHSYQGYDLKEQAAKRLIYGNNEINVPVQSIFTLLVLEALTPFYIFQVFSLIVWLAEFYYYYAIAIIIMSMFGISTSIIQTRKNQKNLKGTVHSTDRALVRRGKGSTFEEIATTDLVPGDLIVIPPQGCEMQCDAVLLNGTCIVNESMLTGESVPVSKTVLPHNDKPYSVKENSNNTLYCGTKVIQTRCYGTESVVAVVIRTGYLTSKGELVRSIMYPPPADFKFDQDSYKFIMILSAVAFFGFIYTVFSKYSRNIAPFDIIIKALDLITIAIPPALPAAMTVGKLYALNRLKKSNIFCINSRVINVSGSVNCICFDKTGTLTEDGLDMWGVVPVNENSIRDAIKDTLQMDENCLLFQGMLTCHSITLINNELCGDPLDIKMFESTGWILEEPEVQDISKYDLLVPTVVRRKNKAENGADEIEGLSEIGIAHQYQFSSTLQRMSVISRKLGSDHFNIFCKGSPEMIMSLSRPETIPSGILERLKEYTQEGYRVIGMGTRKIVDVPSHKIPKLQREEVECDLEFVGLIILENRLKPETSKVIRMLRDAGMKIVMITGDNVQTAVSVARECGIILPDHHVIDVVTTKPTKLEVASIQYHQTGPVVNTFNGQIGDIERQQEKKFQLVINGNSWADVTKYFPDLLSKIAAKGAVFARMSGQQKQQLIEELQNLGYYVAMCGDGANDCGALKAAHVGISLSEAESSVASPFTSKEPNISCTVKVVQEGRAALVTSFGVFKLMLCYSLTEFASCIILYAIDSNLTSLQFLFIDICLILNFASFFGKAEAHPKLHKRSPMTSLLSFVPLTSIVLFMVATIGFQMIAYYFVQTYEWFAPFVPNPNDTTFYSSYENYAVFTVSLFQYITMAIVFSKGKPYRKNIYTNYFLSFSLILMIAICAYITLEPAKWIQDALELKIPPVLDGRYFVLILGAINFIVCIVIEEFIVGYLLHKKIEPRFKNLDKSPQKYLKIDRDLRVDQSWPDVKVPIFTSTTVNETKEVNHYRNGIVNNAFNKEETTRC